MEDASLSVFNRPWLLSVFNLTAYMLGMSVLMMIAFFGVLSMFYSLYNIIAVVVFNAISIPLLFSFGVMKRVFPELNDG